MATKERTPSRTRASPMSPPNSPVRRSKRLKEKATKERLRFLECENNRLTQEFDMLTDLLYDTLREKTELEMDVERKRDENKKIRAIIKDMSKAGTTIKELEKERDKLRKLVEDIRNLLAQVDIPESNNPHGPANAPRCTII